MHHNTKHGLSRSRMYKIWKGIKNRCLNINNKDYIKYNQKGLYYKWKNDFKIFYDWSMNNGYKDNLSIDRIDNNKGYYPTNCRWVTRIQQENNKTTNKYLEYNNKKLTYAEWARELNIPYYLIKNRLYAGWTIDKIFNTPYKRSKK